jgi:hypothetical protein
MGNGIIHTMKPAQKDTILWNNYKIFLLHTDKYWTINISIDVSMSKQELDTYLSYKVAETTNEEVLFFYIKQQNSYLIFITKKLYIESLTKKYPKTTIVPLSIAYKSLLNDDSWAVFNINEDNAFIVTNINKILKTNTLPLSLSHIKANKQDIIKTIVSFINNMMPHIDELETIKNIYIDSHKDIIQKLNGKNVYKDINITKLNTNTFNPKKLFFNFATIKSFRLFFLIGLLAFLIGGFFSTKIYLNTANNALTQEINSQIKQYNLINNNIQTIKTIKEQIATMQKNNDKQIILNSNFSNRLLKLLSSQDKVIKTISMDTNKSYVK